MVSIGNRLGVRPKDIRLAQRIGIALVSKALTLGSLNRSEEEIGVYDEVVRRFGEAAEPALREHVAEAIELRSSLNPPPATARRGLTS